jgi:hypothetical protein
MYVIQGDTQNGNFETPGDQDNNLTDWTFDVSGSGQGIRDTSVPKTGTHNVTADSVIGAGSVTLTSDFAMQTGHTYRAKVWVRSSSGLMQSDISMTVGEFATPLQFLSGSSHSAYAQYTFNFVSTGVDFAIVMGFTSNTDPWFLDDVTLEDITVLHTITPSVTGGHGQTMPYDAVSVIEGTNQDVDLIPDVGYHIDSVTVDGSPSGTNSPHTFSDIQADHAIDVVFAINTFDITLNSPTNGSIYPFASANVNYGGSLSIAITPNAGYELDTILVDGSPVPKANPYVFTNVTADHLFQCTMKVKVGGLSTVTLPEFAGAPAQRFGKFIYINGVSVNKIDVDSVKGQNHLLELYAAGIYFTLS